MVVQLLLRAAPKFVRASLALLFTIAPIAFGEVAHAKCVQERITPQDSGFAWIRGQPDLNGKPLWKLGQGFIVTYCGYSTHDDRKPPIEWHWVSFEYLQQPWKHEGWISSRILEPVVEAQDKQPVQPALPTSPEQSQPPVTQAQEEYRQAQHALEKAETRLDQVKQEIAQERQRSLAKTGQWVISYMLIQKSAAAEHEYGDARLRESEAQRQFENVQAREEQAREVKAKQEQQAREEAERQRQANEQERALATKIEQAIKYWQEQGYQYTTVNDFLIDGKDLVAKEARIIIAGKYVRVGDADLLMNQEQINSHYKIEWDRVGIPILIDDATRPLRAALLNCRELIPTRERGCDVFLLARATLCTRTSLDYTRNNVPCLNIIDDATSGVPEEPLPTIKPPPNPK